MDAAAITNLVFSGTVALATGVYAVLTWRLVQETQALRRVETDPHLSVYVEPSSRLFHATELVITNIGRGPAYETRLTLEKGDWVIHENPNQVLSLHPIFRNSIRYLAPGQVIRTYVGKGPDLWKRGVLDLEIAASYRGLGQDTHRTEKFFVSIRHFEGITAIGEPPEVRLADAAKKLADAVVAMKGQSNRLKVEVHSREQISRANRELMRRYEREKELQSESPESEEGASGE